MLGINYRYDKLSETFTPYAEFGLGYDHFIATGEGKEDAAKGASKLAYASNGALAWQIGAGVIIGKYFSAGLSFVSYGSHRIEYTSGTIDDHSGLLKNGNLTELNSDGTDAVILRRTLNSLTIKLGFHF